MIKLLRSEKIMYSFYYYVSDEMGSFYDEIGITTMESVYNDSDFSTPIIYILS